MFTFEGIILSGRVVKKYEKYYDFTAYPGYVVGYAQINMDEYNPCKQSSLGVLNNF